MRLLRALLLALLLVATPAAVLPSAAPALAADWEGVIDITFPVTGDNYRYTNDYHSDRSRGAHGSTDIMAPYGTPIVAARGGRVSWVSTPATSGCGYCLFVRGDDGRTYGYIHMGPKSSGRNSAAFSRTWREGDSIGRGQTLGYVGCSGNASCGGGEHLHFQIEDRGVRDPYGDNRRNPYASLRAAEKRSACKPNATFRDVCVGSTHEDNIELLADEGLTKGCASGRFCPGRAVTREEMASFLTRALELAPRGRNPFQDVTNDNVHRQTIAALAAEDITRGCAARRFCPDDRVTRGQMASFLVRALELPAAPERFSDVASAHTHAGDIGALARSGLTAGCGSGRFCPDTPVTRGEMASFLVRAFVR